ncbi:Signal transduction histidine-protein kinase BarA [Legionella massiliensis]|uniref:Signal transduction histidine-protein kinase BarA n=1 Tax=Legionella massiliensis TaxID=1034943 RepID=A0A078L157_9GAMM|nr:response regulator [Legionella massiliensis]CDZ77769.1 Signal transduction histidine-protein kinase BarA [Legionella massiliensis]CEE13507.1 Signal transduction histidine-protein kinase BarA [Legionella massiliensis]
MKNDPQLDKKKIKRTEKPNVIFCLEQLVNDFPGCIYWKNIDGIYLGCSQYYVLIAGLTKPEEIIGKNDKAIWGEKYAKTIEINDQKVLETGKSLTFYERVIIKGEEKYFATIKKPLKDNQGKVIGIIANSIDVTELDDAQQKAIMLPALGSKSKKEQEQSSTNQQETVRILIVEDNMVAARAVQAAIKRLYSHCICDRAETGQQAVKMAGEYLYDFILMDIGLSDIDGIAATKQIRALAQTKNAQVPIIALTGHANDFDKRTEALAVGMQDVYAKPLNAETLESLIVNYVLKGKKNQSDDNGELFTKPNTHDVRPIIDWAQCLKQFSGDEDCVRELLAALAIDLTMSQERLIKAYEAHNEESLRTELHRVRGGVICLSLPQLTQALADFHEAVKAKPQLAEHLEKTFNDLLDAINSFWITLD